MTASEALKEWRETGREFTYRPRPGEAYPIFYHDSQSWGDRAGRGDSGSRDGSNGRPVLLLIHGFPTASWDWRAVWPLLQPRFRLIAPDMIGFGFSARPRNYDYSLFDQADLLVALLAYLEVDELYLLAHDYGDTVAQELLARQREGQQPATIRAACLLNGGIFPERIRPRPLQRLLLSPLGPLVSRLINEPLFRRRFAAIFGPATQPTAEELHDFWLLVNHDDGARLAHKLIHYMRERRRHRDRWVSALQETEVPLRFVVGPLDPVSGLHMAERYRELVPEPDVVLLDGIGHYPQLEDPAGVARETLAFFEALP